MNKLNGSKQAVFFAALSMGVFSAFSGNATADDSANLVPVTCTGTASSGMPVKVVVSLNSQRELTANVYNAACGALVYSAPMPIHFSGGEQTWYQSESNEGQSFSLNTICLPINSPSCELNGALQVRVSPGDVIESDSMSCVAN